MGLLLNGGQGGLLDAEVQPGGEAQRPEHPQGVLLKAQLRAAHAADAAVLQIRKPVERVHEQPVRGQGHGVDGEVPAAQVGGQLPHEAHRLRVAVVHIVLLRAEGGDLHGAGVDADGDRAVLQPGGQGAGKNRHHLLRQGAGADIPIVGPDAQRHIPDAAAHQIGHMTPGLETAQNLAHVFRGRDIFHKHTSPKKASYKGMSGGAGLFACNAAASVL